MPFLKRFTKAPAEVIDYDLDFEDFLIGRGDSIDVGRDDGGFTVEADSGVLLDPPAFLVGGTAVRVFVTGGVSGRSYKVAANVFTEGGLEKRGEIQIRVRGGTPMTGIVIDGGDGEDMGGGIVLDGGDGET